jgi:hypothetical protein
VRLVSRGDAAVILLEDPKDNSLFAECAVSEHAVERAADSSRYFVLRCVGVVG